MYLHHSLPLQLLVLVVLTHTYTNIQNKYIYTYTLKIFKVVRIRFQVAMDKALAVLRIFPLVSSVNGTTPHHTPHTTQYT